MIRSKACSNIIHITYKIIDACQKSFCQIYIDIFLTFVNTLFQGDITMSDHIHYSIENGDENNLKSYAAVWRHGAAAEFASATLDDLPPALPEYHPEELPGELMDELRRQLKSAFGDEDSANASWDWDWEDGPECAHEAADEYSHAYCEAAVAEAMKHSAPGCFGPAANSAVEEDSANGSAQGHANGLADETADDELSRAARALIAVARLVSTQPDAGCESGAAAAGFTPATSAALIPVPALGKEPVSQEQEIVPASAFPAFSAAAAVSPSPALPAPPAPLALPVPPAVSASPAFPAPSAQPPNAETDYCWPPASLPLSQAGPSAALRQVWANFHAEPRPPAVSLIVAVPVDGLTLVEAIAAVSRAVRVKRAELEAMCADFPESCKTGYRWRFTGYSNGQMLYCAEEDPQRLPDYFDFAPLPPVPASAALPAPVRAPLQTPASAASRPPLPDFAPHPVSGPASGVLPGPSASFAQLQPPRLPA
jgi:hypothetical protein